LAKLGNWSPVDPRRKGRDHYILAAAFGRNRLNYEANAQQLSGRACAQAKKEFRVVPRRMENVTVLCRIQEMTESWEPDIRSLISMKIRSTFTTCTEQACKMPSRPGRESSFAE